MKSETHAKLIGHLNFLAQALTAPNYIRSHYQIVSKEVSINKGRDHVFKYHFKEPETGTLVPVDAGDIGFVGISTYGRPLNDTLWGHAALVCDCLVHATGELEKTLPPYDTLLASLVEVADDPQIAEVRDDPSTLEIVRTRIMKLQELTARKEELGKPIEVSDMAYPYLIDVNAKRYGLYKTNASLELIKALRRVNHPGVRRTLARRFARGLYPYNPELAAVLNKIK